MSATDPETGLPYVRFFANTTVILQNLLGREVRNLTNPVTWCTRDSEMKDWCGSNSTLVYSYCISHEDLATQYPFEDTKWLYNSTFAPNSMPWPLVPSICACVTPGRAYWIPASVDPLLSYKPECHEEGGILACFILLALGFLFLGSWVIMEILVWSVLYCRKMRKCEIFSTYLSKIFTFLACSFAILCIIINTSYTRTNYGVAVTSTYFWILAIDLIILAYGWWLLVFIDVLLKMKKLRDTPAKIVSVSKWAIIIFITLILIGNCTTTGVFYRYAITILTTHNFTDLIPMAKTAAVVKKTNALFSLIAIFIVCAWGTVLSLIAAIFIWTRTASSRTSDELKDKVIWTSFATLSFWCLFGPVVCYAVLDPWQRGVQMGLTNYRLNILWYWLLFIEGTFGLLVLFGVSMAIRTTFKDGQGYCSTLSNGSKGSK
jgi:hypothetical protein